jgi:hypothetical protein
MIHFGKARQSRVLFIHIHAHTCSFCILMDGHERSSDKNIHTRSRKVPISMSYLPGNCQRWHSRSVSTVWLFRPHFVTWDHTRETWATFQSTLALVSWMFLFMEKILWMTFPKDEEICVCALYWSHTHNTHNTQHTHKVDWIYFQEKFILISPCH